MGSKDHGSESDKLGNNGAGFTPLPDSEEEEEEEEEEEGKEREEDLKSCTCTNPSYHPLTTILSDAPHGNAGGVPQIAYTADGLLSPVVSLSLDEEERMAEGETEMVEERTGWMIRGLVEERPKAA